MSSTEAAHAYKRNLSVIYGWLTTNFEHVLHLECILQDINRPYMKDVIHRHGCNFSFLPMVSRISLNAPDCIQMAPILQTTIVKGVIWIVITIYIIV
jgi:hypothetical protein